jgi:hypothetical protein
MHLDEGEHEMIVFPTVIVCIEAMMAKVRKVEHDGMTTQSFFASILKIIY